MEVKGRCMKCNEERVMESANVYQTKRKVYMAKGTCPVCHSIMATLVSQKKIEG